MAYTFYCKRHEAHTLHVRGVCLDCREEQEKEEKRKWDALSQEEKMSRMHKDIQNIKRRLNKNTEPFLE